MKYLVTVAGREVEVEVDGEQVTVGGRTVVAALAPVPGTPLRLLTIEGRTVGLPVEPVERGRWGVSWQGERYEVEVIDERTRHIRSLTARPAGPAGAGVLRAPMPGLVVRVPVTVGQAVVAGAGVLVLEAMKMENELKAGAAAVVKAILVQPGQVVEKGQVLVEFDPPHP